MSIQDPNNDAKEDQAIDTIDAQISPSIVESFSGTESEKPKVESPHQLIEGFRNSDPYRTSFQRFLETHPIPITDKPLKEQQKLFENFGNASVSDAFFTYSKDDIEFLYNAQAYPEDVQKAIRNYEDTVREIRKGQRYMDRDQILAMDRQRSYFHGKAAETLIASDIVSSPTLGRAVVSLILIGKGLEDYDSASTPMSERIKKLYL